MIKEISIPISDKIISFDNNEKNIVISLINEYLKDFNSCEVKESEYYHIFEDVTSKFIKIEFDVSDSYDNINFQIHKVTDDYYVIISYLYFNTKKHYTYKHTSGILNGLTTDTRNLKLTFLVDGLDGLVKFSKKILEYAKAPILNIEKFINHMIC